MKARSTFPFLFCILVGATFPACHYGEDWADNSSGDGASIDAVIACSRDAEVRGTNMRFYNPVDHCDGSVTIQGISYLCGKQSDVVPKTREFLADLNERARKRCEEYCEDHGKDCEGSYHEASACGFSVEPSNAVEVGTKIVGCHPSCEGVSFIYCSLYHGSYFRIEDALFKDDQPNCFCQKKRR